MLCCLLGQEHALLLATVITWLVFNLFGYKSWAMKRERHTKREGMSHKAEKRDKLSTVMQNVTDLALLLIASKTFFLDQLDPLCILFVCVIVSF